ncbi:MAG: metallophosphoesterase [Kiritimatiellia bacterium]
MRRLSCCLGVTLCCAFAVWPGRPAPAVEAPAQFRVWAAGDSHASGDFQHGYESVAVPLRQAAGLVSNAPGFDWDIMVDAGDCCGGQGPPGDAEGQVLVDQYRSLTKNYREDIYHVAGNHDADYYDLGAGAWFSKWVDPTGAHTDYSGVHPELRRFAVDGTWERYKFQAGNILFLMMSDYNSAPPPVGRGSSREALKGGFPAGAVTRATFDWWKQQVLSNQDKIIVSMHHHMLRDTTTWAKHITKKGFHGSSGGVEGSGYLYHIIENPDPENFEYTPDAHVFEDFLEAFQKEHGRPAIDLWLGGHSHPASPTETVFGQGLTETMWGVTFVQCGALTKYHAGRRPMSRLITFMPGRAQAEIQLYVHSETRNERKYKVQRHMDLGWFEEAAKTVTLRHPFVAPPADTRPAPSSVYGF